ncbi:MAG: hypothetical protein JWL69_140, partial [Phycisphaerales bacterium]|nr:hypothetical protein [Phycisphaerales bacterium]
MTNPFDLRASLVFGLLLLTPGVRGKDAEPGTGPRQESAQSITHSFLALGAETYIMDADGKVTWSYPKNTRDGWVLPTGHVLLAVTKD